VTTEYQLPPQSLDAPAAVGTSRVYFYNQQGDRAALGSKRIGIKVDGRGVAALSAGQFVRIDLEPGRHHLELSESDTLEFRDEYALLVGGRDLYVRVYSTSLTANFDVSEEQSATFSMLKPAIKARR
jgi:hypothetical protein